MFRLLCLIMIIPSMVCGQGDSLSQALVYLQGEDQLRQGTKPLGRNKKMFKLFSSGKVDYISGGMLRSSTKIAEINVGDPSKFYLPLYIMVGAISQPTDEGINVNMSTSADLINNFGGLLNVGTSGRRDIRKLGESTKLAAIYQVAIKSVSGTSLEMDESVSMYSKIFVSGFQIDTKAWKSGELPSDGKAWLKTYLSYSVNDRQKTMDIFGCDSVHNFIIGNVECGVDIKDFIDLRFGYHQYLNNQNIAVFQQGIYVFSANFALAGEKEE
jgi:hypothetical protein